MNEFALIKPLAVADFTRRLLQSCSGIKQPTVYVNISTNLPHHSWSFGGEPSKLFESDDFTQIVEAGKNIPTLLCSVASVEIDPGNRQGRKRFLVYEVDTNTQIGGFRIEHVLDKEKCAEIAGAVSANFDVFSVSEILLVASDDANASAVKARKAAVAELDKQSDRLRQFLEELAKLQTENALRIERELSEKYAAREADLDKSIREKLKHLESKEAELRKQQNEFDARESTVLRRENIDKLRQAVQGRESFKLSKLAYKNVG
ncbi:MAG: hypothetical protein KDA29_07065 [Phycisphaerales bacterium]|nr:hypothetical protein [Phycisphaerales bacterium]